MSFLGELALWGILPAVIFLALAGGLLYAGKHPDRVRGIAWDSRKGIGRKGSSRQVTDADEWKNAA